MHKKFSLQQQSIQSLFIFTVHITVCTQFLHTCTENVLHRNNEYWQLVVTSKYTGRKLQISPPTVYNCQDNWAAELNPVSLLKFLWSESQAQMSDILQNKNKSSSVMAQQTCLVVWDWGFSKTEERNIYRAHAICCIIHDSKVGLRPRPTPGDNVR